MDLEQVALAEATAHRAEQEKQKILRAKTLLLGDPVEDVGTEEEPKKIEPEPKKIEEPEEPKKIEPEEPKKVEEPEKPKTEPEEPKKIKPEPKENEPEPKKIEEPEEPKKIEPEEPKKVDEKVKPKTSDNEMNGAEIPMVSREEQQAAKKMKGKLKGAGKGNEKEEEQPEKTSGRGRGRGRGNANSSEAPPNKDQVAKDLAPEFEEVAEGPPSRRAAKKARAKKPKETEPEPKVEVVEVKDQQPEKTSQPPKKSRKRAPEKPAEENPIKAPKRTFAGRYPPNDPAAKLRFDVLQAEFKKSIEPKTSCLSKVEALWVKHGRSIFVRLSHLKIARETLEF